MAAPTQPEELLFQGGLDVLVPGREDVAQEWARKYMCVWCNPPCFALFASEIAAKRAPDFYVSLPPNSEWHEDADFQGAPPGTSFRLEAQVRGLATMLCGLGPEIARCCRYRTEEAVCFALFASLFCVVWRLSRMVRGISV
jgi:hypothetical protein